MAASLSRTLAFTAGRSIGEGSSVSREKTRSTLPSTAGSVFPYAMESTAPAALAAALQAVLADPDAARTRADAAYTNLCAHFTWQAVFATMEKTAAQAAKRS